MDENKYNHRECYISNITSIYPLHAPEGSSVMRHPSPEEPSSSFGSAFWDACWTAESLQVKNSACNCNCWLCSKCRASLDGETDDLKSTNWSLVEVSVEDDSKMKSNAKYPMPGKVAEMQNRVWFLYWVTNSKKTSQWDAEIKKINLPLGYISKSVTEVSRICSCTAAVTLFGEVKTPDVKRKTCPKRAMRIVRGILKVLFVRNEGGKDSLIFGREITMTGER